MTPSTTRTIRTLAVSVCAGALMLSVGTRAQSGLPFSALPERAQSPAGATATPDTVALGRMLFWDPILSGANDVACATCHHPEFGYADGAQLSIGTGGVGMGPMRQFASDETSFVRRNSPTVLNVAFNGMGVDGRYDPMAAPMFWDNRTRSLEAQALEPIKAGDEMRGALIHGADSVAAAVGRLTGNAEYQQLFRKAFGNAQAITAANVSRAIAAYERSLVATDAPFDRYMRGDRTALTPGQLRGMQAFQDAGCAACHSGPMFSDYQLHVLGVRDNPKLATSDTGAGGYAFRTPTLRNLAVTGPYMHNGTLTSLPDVLDFYNTVGRGGRGGQGGRGGPGGLGGPAGVRGGRPAPPAGSPALQVAQGPSPAGQPGGVGGPGRGGRGGRTVINANVPRGDLDPLLRQVRVGNRRGDILQFLQALNSDFDRTVPTRVPSGLQPGGRLR